MAMKCKLNPEVKKLAQEFARAERRSDDSASDDLIDIGRALANAVKSRNVIICHGRATMKKKG